MLDMCNIKNGSRVLDVAAGAGEQTLAVAQRIGENGQVLATDLSPEILQFASSSAKLAGLNNVQTHVIDGESLAELESDPFDAVISRVGLIYFPDQPGPFSLGCAGKLEQVFALAGFNNIEVETINAPVRVSSAAECLQFEQESFGALHQMLSGLSDMEQDEAWCEIEEALTPFESNGQFGGPCEMRIAVGCK